MCCKSCNCKPFPKKWEAAKGKTALRELPPSIRKYYVIHYYIGMSDSEPDYGNFVGLVCKSCNCWQECGHKEDCPVEVLEERANKARERLQRKGLVSSGNETK